MDHQLTHVKNQPDNLINECENMNRKAETVDNTTGEDSSEGSDEEDSSSSSSSSQEDSQSDSNHSSDSSAKSKNFNTKTTKLSEFSEDENNSSKTISDVDKSPKVLKTAIDLNSSSSSTLQSNNHSQRSKNDFKKILENFPDALRRSSRSRKEPDRFQIETVDSDDSDTPKSLRKHKRNNLHDWNDDSSLESVEDSSSEDDNHRRSNRKTRHRKQPRKVNNRSSTNSRQSEQLARNSTRSFSESDDTDQDDDDEDEDFVEPSRSRNHHRSSRKKTRRATEVVNYKEVSDYTDSDDLVDCEQTGEDGLTTVADELEEEGEMIEKVLEHRWGLPGATGPCTTMYQIQESGDPNADFKLNHHQNECEKELQFFIKWKNWSYIHCTWESKNSLEQQKVLKGVKKIEIYLKKDEEIRQWMKTASPEDVDYYECQEEMNYQLRQLHMNVERVIARQSSKNEKNFYSENNSVEEQQHQQQELLCKWECLPYAECTWEDGTLIKKLFAGKVNEFFQREKSSKTPIAPKYCRVLKQRPKFIPIKQQPKFIGGVENLELRDYQLDGLNWLVQSWCRENSVILADEMGLGKTIQTISFLNYLFEEHSVYGPFLLVVPLSTLAAWQKEFDQWAPAMNVVVYIGDSISRNMIRQYEWQFCNTNRLKFNVLLTTYEIVLRDKAFLQPVPWAVLGVDEAHRLKNDESFLYKCLSSFDTNHRLLITGTPLQNSLRELWALLHFIMPDLFNSWESFEIEHKDSYQKGFNRLHQQIQQYLLRRVKKDVEKSLPAKVEQILRVDMTSIQKQYYKWILTKNYKALSKGLKGSLFGFTNIVMELKKCCNHAILVRPIDELDHLDTLQRLIRGSGKLLLLDKLLCRLKETGHRVLIFSQMVRMLDLLGEYLSLRRFSYQRLDGSIRGEFRKQALDHFNAEGSQDFCFLLSTRAGGLGINLATADTVIIFDSDWNPQNDLQAQARAHRIGQKNQVNIYRLVTKGSVEEDIIERAKRKMVLDHLVIQRMDTSGHTVIRNQTLEQKNDETKSNSTTTPFNKEELAAILKFGAEDLFKETDNGDEEPQCDIDEILKRAETRDEDDAPHTLGDELLSSFKVASFNFNEEEDVQAAVAVQKSWDDIIPEEERKKIDQEERQKEAMEMMLPRSRNKTNKMSGNKSDSGDEYDPSAKNAADSGSDDSDGERPRRRGRPKSSYKELIKGFSEAEVRRFIKSFKKFANPMLRLESIAIDSELQEKPLPDLQRLANELQQGCENILKQQSEKEDNENGNKKSNNRGPSFKLGGVTVFAKGILSNQKELEPLALMLPSNIEDRKKWMLTGIKVKSSSWDCSWLIEDDSRLLAGVYEYGFGSWESIKMDPTFKLSDKILPNGDQKPQAKQLQSRVEYLLKLMHRHLATQTKPAEKLEKRLKLSSTNEKLSKNSVDNRKIQAENSPKKKKPSLNEEIAAKKSKKNKNKEHKKKDKKKHRKEKKEKVDKDEDIDNLGLPSNVFLECKEKMRAVKKALKMLNKMDESNESSKSKKDAFYEYIGIVGAHIDRCLEEHRNDSIKMKEWRNNLWTFVSKFTEFRPKHLYQRYRHFKNKTDSVVIKSSSSFQNTGTLMTKRSGEDHDRHHTSRNEYYAMNHHRTTNDSKFSNRMQTNVKREYSGTSESTSGSKYVKHSRHDYGPSIASPSYLPPPNNNYYHHSSGPWSFKHDNYRNSSENDQRFYGSHTKSIGYSASRPTASDRDFRRRLVTQSSGPSINHNSNYRSGQPPTYPPNIIASSGNSYSNGSSSACPPGPSAACVASGVNHLYHHHHPSSTSTVKPLALLPTPSTQPPLSQSSPH